MLKRLVDRLAQYNLGRSFSQQSPQPVGAALQRSVGLGYSQLLLYLYSAIHTVPYIQCHIQRAAAATTSRCSAAAPVCWSGPATAVQCHKLSACSVMQGVSQST